MFHYSTCEASLYRYLSSLNPSRTEAFSLLNCRERTLPATNSRVCGLRRGYGLYWSSMCRPLWTPRGLQLAPIPLSRLAKI